MKRGKLEPRKKRREGDWDKRQRGKLKKEREQIKKRERRRKKGDILLRY